jgi:aspartyl protease family protein
MFAHAIARAIVLSGVATAALAIAATGAGNGETDMFPAGGVAAATMPAVITSASITPPIPVSTTMLRSDRHTDGLFYVQANVNGKPIRFLVDTGASYMVLTDADARAAGIVLGKDQFNGQVSTVGGNAAMAWTRLDRVELAGHDVRDLRAVVVRNGLGVSLLGQNMLAKLDSVTLTSGQLHLR